MTQPSVSKRCMELTKSGCQAAKECSGCCSCKNVELPCTDLCKCGRICD